MAKVFYPKMYLMVPASAPHPQNTEYRVSIGEELWEGKKNLVLKVQMVYKGEVAGRRSPSYPLGTDDLQRVMIAQEKLLAQFQSSEIKVI